MAIPSLFDRLGGTSGIERIVDAVVARHLENPVIRVRFQPYLADPETLRTLKAHLARFLELGSGGPQRYTGRDMRSAHTGLNISPEEYVAAIDDILGALEQAGLDEQTRKDVLMMTWSLKRDIVHV